MEEKSKIFLNQFESSVQTEIIEFGKRISSTKANVYLLMARKAACFIGVLEELGFVNLDGYVTSERVLDMECSWLKDKSVIIIDDAVVSGTTIYKTIQKLKDIGVKEMQVYALSANKKWFEEKLLECNDKDCVSSYLAEPYKKLDDKECIKMCSDIVTSLSVIPRPYDIDFPYFKDIKISKSCFEKVIRLSGWESHNISSSLQINNELFSITFLPTDYAKIGFDNRIGCNISEVAMLKIRIYGRYIEKSKKSYSIRIVPIVALKEISVEKLNSLYSCISNVLGNDKEEFNSHFTTNKSKLRFVQFVLASQLANYWIRSISKLIKNKINLIHDARTLSLLFPRKIGFIVDRLSLMDMRIIEFIPIEKDSSTVRMNMKDYKTDICGADLISLQARLVEPFLRLYRDKEIPARMKVKALRKEVFSCREDCCNTIGRLDEGYSIDDLQHIISHTNEYDVSKVVSIFLDKAIDAGIVVPISAEKDGMLFRAYRHGEDVLFGERQENLLAHMLLSFQESCGRSGLPQIWVEKLIVLFNKIGLQNKFLEPFVSNIPFEDSFRNKSYYREDILSIKYYLYGPVAVFQSKEFDDSIIDKPYITEDSKAHWMTNILLNKHILEYDQDNKHYLMGTLPDSIADGNIAPDVEIIGDIFGTLLKNRDENINPQLSNKDLIMLTACIRPEDIAPALAAEINIFLRTWGNFVSEYNRSSNDRKNYFAVASRIRKKTNNYFAALNSGKMKFYCFINKEPQDLIKRISLEFKTKVERNLWLKFWSPNTDWEECSVNKELMDIIYYQGLWIIRISLYVRLLDFLIRKHAVIENPINKETNTYTCKNLLKEIEEHCEKIKELEKYNINLNLQDIIDYVKSIVDKVDRDDYSIKPRIDEVLIIIENLCNKAKPKLEEVDLLINNFGRPESIIRYTDCIYLDVDVNERSERNMAFRKIINIFNNYQNSIESSNKIKYSNTSFLRIPEKDSPFRGIWIATSGSNASYHTIMLAHHLLYSGSKFCNVKVVVFSKLPEDARIKVGTLNISNIKYGDLWKKLYRIDKHLKINDISFNEIVGIIEENDNIKDEYNILAQQGKYNIYRAKEEKVVETDYPYNERYKIKFFRRKEGQNVKKNNIDIGIITVVTPETQAVIKNMKECTEVTGKNIRRLYYGGKFDGLNTDHTVVVTEQLEQGNMSAIAAYNDLIEKFNPKLVILLGIGGSISPKNTLCDVVIAEQVIHYDKRKEHDEGVSIRGETYRISPQLLTYIKKFFIKYGEEAALPPTENSFNRDKFTVSFGPVGSGNAVITNSASYIKSWLLEYNSKTLAVEMEASGICHAFHEGQLLEKSPSKGVLIIRGISDHADKEKSDIWRVPSAENAATTLKELLKLIPKL